MSILHQLLRMGQGTVLRLSPLIIFGFALMGWGCTDYRGEIWLINKASSHIVRAEVEVCDQTIVLEGLQPGESQRSSY